MSELNENVVVASEAPTYQAPTLETVGNDVVFSMIANKVIAQGEQNDDGESTGEMQVAEFTDGKLNESVGVWLLVPNPTLLAEMILSNDVVTESMVATIKPVTTRVWINPNELVYARHNGAKIDNEDIFADYVTSRKWQFVNLLEYPSGSTDYPNADEDEPKPLKHDNWMAEQIN